VSWKLINVWKRRRSQEVDCLLSPRLQVLQLEARNPG